jgi:hypothetical protein
MSPERAEWFHAVCDQLDAEELAELCRHERAKYKLSIRRSLIEDWAEGSNPDLVTLNVFDAPKKPMPGIILASHKRVR